MRQSPVPTLPLRSFLSLHIKRRPNSVFLNINLNRPPLHRYRNLLPPMPRSPTIVKLRLNMMMFIMQRRPQKIVINLIDLFFQLVSDSFHMHDVVEHLPQIFLIIISCVRRIHPCQMERLPGILVPCHLVVIQ